MTPKDPPIFTKNDGWKDEYSLTEAVRSIANEPEFLEDRTDSLAIMVAAILETLPQEEALRILNAASRKVWSIRE